MDWETGRPGLRRNCHDCNEDLDDTSPISDPYGDGWILVIEASNLDEDLGNLIHGSGCAFIDSQLRKAEEEKAKA